MVENKGMDMARFGRILDAYGAEERFWPADERDAAHSLLAENEEANALWREAAAVDDLLNRSVAPSPSPEIMADILAAASPRPWRRWAVVLWPFGPLWRPFSGLAAAMVLGILIGVTSVATDLPGDAETAYEIDEMILGPELG